MQVSSSTDKSYRLISFEAQNACLEDELRLFCSPLGEEIRQFLLPLVEDLLSSMERPPKDSDFDVTTVLSNAFFLRDLSASASVNLFGTIEDLTIPSYPPVFYKDSRFSFPLGFSGVSVTIHTPHPLSILSGSLPQTIGMVRSISGLIDRTFSSRFFSRGQEDDDEGTLSRFLSVLDLVAILPFPAVVYSRTTHRILAVTPSFLAIFPHRAVGRHIAEVLPLLAFSPDLLQTVLTHDECSIAVPLARPLGLPKEWRQVAVGHDSFLRVLMASSHEANC
jgi:hypothetical protein